MLRSAFGELRLHPGRVTATLIAIVISISFVSGSLIYTATVRESISRATSLHLSHADVVIQGVVTPELLSSVRMQIGVEGADYSTQTGIPLASPTDAGIFYQYYTMNRTLAWSKIARGRWPSTADEIALSPTAAETLKVGIADTITVNRERKYTVVGLTDDQKLPTALLDAVYVVPDVAESQQTIVVSAARSTDLPALVNRLKSIVRLAGNDSSVMLGAEVRERQLLTTTNDFDVLKYTLLAFAATALLVGMLIITKTFNILVAQRGQQIGLLRAVGATRAQIQTGLLIEAAVLGLIGSVAGISLGVGFATFGGWMTSTLAWGTFLPWFELTLLLAGGVMVTVLAALVPCLRATKVPPLEALRIVPSGSRSKRFAMVRYLVCGVLAALGVVLSYLSVFTTKLPLDWAVVAGWVIVFAVLGLFLVFVPGLFAGLWRVADIEDRHSKWGA